MPIAYAYRPWKSRVPMSARYHRKLGGMQTRTKYTVTSPQKRGPKPR